MTSTTALEPANRNLESGSDTLQRTLFIGLTWWTVQGICPGVDKVRVRSSFCDILRVSRSASGVGHDTSLTPRPPPGF